MTKNYSNSKIYRNCRIVKILSTISLILSILTLIAFVVYKFIGYTNVEGESSGFLAFFFCIYITSIPLVQRQYDIQAHKTDSNDFANSLTAVIITFIPYIQLIIMYFWFLCINSSSSSVLVWAYECGYMLPAHVFLYIADGFLIHNCVLIKREWKVNPPDFVKEQQAKKEQKAQIRTNNKNSEQYKSLIKKCGIKFFIKYYKQIKRLPLRDVTVSEDYTPTEKEERLLAAKKLIDLGLTEFALNEILITYSDILDTAEIKQAKALLEELKSNH